MPAKEPAALQRQPPARLWYGIGALLLLASGAVRLLAYPIITSDYTYFVAKWVDALRAHPWLTAFQQPFADYAPLYLYFLKLLALLPVYSLYSAKTLSFCFDVLIALFCCGILKMLSPRFAAPGAQFFSFALMLAIPTVAINSSLWGQSDSIYAAGAVAALYYMLRGNPLLAALAYGFSLSIKVQAIFFLPVFAGWCIADWRRRGWYLAVPPIFFLVTLIPAWLSGGSWPYWLSIYLHQAGEYPWLDVSAQSIFAYANTVPVPSGNATLLFWLGIIAATAAALAAFLFLVRRKAALSGRELLFAALFCAALIPYFLPRMHERYFYLADIFAVLYALFLPRRWLIPVVVVFSSFLAYMPFLSKQVSWFAAFTVDLRLPATLMLGLAVYLILIESPVYWAGWRSVVEHALDRAHSSIKKHYGTAPSTGYDGS